MAYRSVYDNESINNTFNRRVLCMEWMHRNALSLGQKIATSKPSFHVCSLTTVNNKLAASTFQSRLQPPGLKQHVVSSHAYTCINQTQHMYNETYTHAPLPLRKCRRKWPYNNDSTANWWHYVERHAWYTSARTLSPTQQTQQVYTYVTNGCSKIPQNPHHRN